MNPELARFEDEWRHGDRSVAKQLAREYVDRNRARLSTLLGSYDLQGLVELVQLYRDGGQEENRIICDMWLLSEHQPQKISGEIRIGGAEAAVAAAEAILRDAK